MNSFIVHSKKEANEAGIFSGNVTTAKFFVLALWHCLWKTYEAFREDCHISNPYSKPE